MANDETIKIAINWFREPIGGYRIMVLKATKQGDVRIDNRREPPEGSGVLGAIGFWIDIVAPMGTTRVVILDIFGEIKASLEKMDISLLEPLWADGKSSFEKAGVRVTLGGGMYPGNIEYLERFNRCVVIFQMFTDLKGVDIIT